MTILKTFEQFIKNRIPEELGLPPDSDEIIDEEADKKSEDEQQDIQVEIGIDLRMDKLKNKYGN